MFHVAKLDSEVRILEEQLEEERARRGRATEEMMHETKQWLAGLQHSVGLCVTYSELTAAADDYMESGSS